MRRVMFFLVLVLLPVTGWAQATIRYTPPAGGIISTPLLAPAADNCAAVPYSFTSDDNTGVCSSAADTVGFNAGGTVRFSVTTSTVTSTVPILVPDGSKTAPSLARSAASATGLYWGAGPYLYLAYGGEARLGLVDNFLQVNSVGGYSWRNATDISTGAGDLYLIREAAASIQLGNDAATATAQTISAADSTGAGVAGASLTLSGGTGGTFGAQGNVIVDASSAFVSRNVSISLTADAAIQYGQVVMPDAGTDGRFDVNATNSTLGIGVLGGVGASAQGSAYPVITSGLAYVAPQEDAAVTRGHYLIVSATAGYVADSATVTTDGLNIALSLYSEPVSYNIDPTGCGGGGCINTTSGVITLDTDVAAAGWTVGQPVIYWNSGGTTPTGLTDGAVYFLKTVSTTTVTIATTYGGAAVVPSSQGDDATQYLQRLPLAVVNIH